MMNPRNVITAEQFFTEKPKVKIFVIAMDARAVTNQEEQTLNIMADIKINFYDVSNTKRTSPDA